MRKGLSNSSTELGWLCNGLVRDWSAWQRENGEAFGARLRWCAPARQVIVLVDEVEALMQLVMASMEPLFDPEQDRWWDQDWSETVSLERVL